MNWKEKLETYLRDSCGDPLSKEIVSNLHFSDEDADMLMYAVDAGKSREEIMGIADWINKGKNEDATPDVLREYMDGMYADSAVIGAFLKGFVRITDEMKSYGLDMDFSTRDQRNKWLSYIASDSRMSVDELRAYGRQIVAATNRFRTV